MDVIGSSLREYILKENVELLRTNGIVPSKLSNGFVPVDIDVTPFDNSKTRKEGVSVTYGLQIPEVFPAQSLQLFHPDPAIPSFLP